MISFRVGRVVPILLAVTVALFTAPAAAAELAELGGRHVRVLTDRPAADAASELVEAFDAAVPEWCDFFAVDAAAVDDWQITAYVLDDRAAMRAAGVLPPELPAFHSGFQQGARVWVVRQPTAYYTRHLLLHEGVHALAWKVFGGAGPAWYMEGTAELLATHQWDEGRVRLPVLPARREAVPYWGRFKVIDDWRSKGRIPHIERVMRSEGSATGTPDLYAWTWAVAMLMHVYPEYRDQLIAAARRGEDRGADFTRSFYGALRDEWPRLVRRWHVLASEIDYGYDADRNRVDAVEPIAWDGRAVSLQVAADRGWQETGLTLAPGDRVRIRAEGSYVIGSEPRPWVCEPQGVTIRYHDGRPLGMLVAAVVPDPPAGSETVRPVEPISVGREAQIAAPEGGALLLRIGDDPAELEDNRGAASVAVERLGSDD